MMTTLFQNYFTKTSLWLQIALYLTLTDKYRFSFFYLDSSKKTAKSLAWWMNLTSKIEKNDFLILIYTYIKKKELYKFN